MALEPCPECGEEISEQATECPHCGVEIDRSSGWSRGCVMLGCAPWIIAIIAGVGGLVGGVPGAVVGGVLALLFAIGYVIEGKGGAVSPNKDSTSRNSESQTTETSGARDSEQTDARSIDPDKIEDWRDLKDHERNHYARKLERRATEAEANSNEERSNLLIEEAKEIYWDLVERDFSGSFPYERLAIIYRSENDYENEVRVLKRCLRNADFSTRKKQERFESRLNRAQELQAQG